MTNDIIAVIVFIVVLCIMCKAWNVYAMKQIKHENHLGLKYGSYINDEKKIELAGTESDGNGDYSVSEAIKEIDIPANIRIKA